MKFIEDVVAHLREHKRLYIRTYRQEEVATELNAAGVPYKIERHGGVSLFTLVES